MKIILTGGTGYIGSAVLDALSAHGHEIVAVVRSEQSARSVEARGAVPLLGDLFDTDWLTARLGEVDAAVHAATTHDGTGPAFDAAVVAAVVAAFGGTNKPYVHTGGVWGYGSGDVSEETLLDPPQIVAWRGPLEAALITSDVAATIVAPAVVYGYGKGIPALIGSAPRTVGGLLTAVGDGTQHWTTVHVDDLAALYRLVVESGRGHGRVLGVSGQNPTVRELAEAYAGGPVAAEGSEASRVRLGEPLAEALLLDTRATGAKARSLGWNPTAPSLVEELRGGSYRGAA